MMNDADQNITRVALGAGEEIVFRKITAGEFRTGSRSGETEEEPVHRVVIRRNFWLAETPVTQGQYSRFDSLHESQYTGPPDRPVERLAWDEVNEFCSWLQQKLDGEVWNGWIADLPTEAQWEYACRAGSESDYHTGDGKQALCKAGYLQGNMDAARPVIAADMASNAFGLFGMHGQCPGMVH